MNFILAQIAAREVPLPPAFYGAITLILLLMPLFFVLQLILRLMFMSPKRKPLDGDMRSKIVNVTTSKELIAILNDSEIQLDAGDSEIVFFTVTRLRLERQKFSTEDWKVLYDAAESRTPLEILATNEIAEPAS